MTDQYVNVPKESQTCIKGVSPLVKEMKEIRRRTMSGLVWRVSILIALATVMRLAAGEPQITRLSCQTLPADLYRERYLEPPKEKADWQPLFSLYTPRSACVTHDGNYLVIGTTQIRWDDTDPFCVLYLMVYRLTDSQYTHVLPIEHEWVRADAKAYLECSPDDSSIGVAWHDGVSLFELDKAKGKLKHRWTRDFLTPQHPNGLSLWFGTKCAFSNDGKRLLVTCGEQPLLELDVATGKPIRRIEHAKDFPKDLCNPTHTNGAIAAQHVAIVLDNWPAQQKNNRRGVLLVDITSRNWKFLDFDRPLPFLGSVELAFHPTRNLLIVMYVAPISEKGPNSSNLHLIAWQYDKGLVHKKVLSAQWHTCSDMAFSPDGRYLLLTAVPNWLVDPNLMIFDTTDWSIVKAYRIKPGNDYRLMFAPKADLLLLLSTDGHLVEVSWPKLAKHLQAVPRD